jgi:hypothetical protein
LKRVEIQILFLGDKSQDKIILRLTFDLASTSVFEMGYLWFCYQNGATQTDSGV